MDRFYWPDSKTTGTEAYVTSHDSTDHLTNIKNPARAAEYFVMQSDFRYLCEFGGRLFGTASEQKAVDWIRRKFSEIGTASSFPVETPTWFAEKALLTDAAGSAFAECQPMLRTCSTPAGGLEGEVVDLGKGRAEDYSGNEHLVSGRIVLVDHEYPFSSTHVHRREKIELAIRHGAIAFLMANPLGNGGLLSGAAVFVDEFKPIPCAYICRDAAEQLRSRDKTGRRVRLHIEGKDRLVQSSSLSTLLGKPDAPRIVLTAHVDGHPLGESALDNATGIAVALAASRRLAGRFSEQSKIALQTTIFTAEELGLRGSDKYLQDLPKSEFDKLKLNVNLDTVGGSPNLTALLSGFGQLSPLVQKASSMSGVNVGTYLPMCANSDHFNFARRGIPAFRLVAGFEEPCSRVQHILSAEDTRDKVYPGELEAALEFVCSVIELAIQDPELMPSRLQHSGM